eukprot:1137516-Pelagomonas_calceolata.AAC.1
MSINILLHSPPWADSGGSQITHTLSFREEDDCKTGGNAAHACEHNATAASRAKDAPTSSFD